MDLFDKILSNQGTEEDSEFMPLVSLDEGEESESLEPLPKTLPILALKNTVLFPGLLVPITISREKSIKALNKAHDSKKLLGVLTQKDVKDEEPGFDDLYKVGTVAKIVKILRMPDGTTTAILQGKKRFSIENMITEDPHLEATVKYLDYKVVKNKMEFKAVIKSVREVASEIIQLSPMMPPEAKVVLKNITNDTFLLNFLSSNLGMKISIKQDILELNDLVEKAKRVLEQMDAELQLLELKDQIETKVRGDIEKQQRDYFLSQQLKTIQDELGQNPQEEDIKRLLEKAKKKKWSKEVDQVFKNEINKLKRTNPMVPDYGVSINYLELMIDLPWGEFTKDNFDLQRVKKVLDQDHYGLEKVKERILEHLAVLKLKGDMKAPILCLVGPPGVGKTSLGKSIAKALKRKFIRMSLGGLHDEAEIRGHRKTYIGAMPGRIIQSLKKVKSANPVFILDELDKVGKDFRGDPSSALLEVLDPEQNSTFHDNFANYGGALMSAADGGGLSASVTVDNTTFTNNSAFQSGGAVYVQGSSGGTASPVFTHVTFAGNQAPGLGGGALAVYGSAGTALVSVRNSILTMNTGSTTADANVLVSAGAVMLDTSNVTGGCPAAASCVNPIDLVMALQPLDWNGGATQTMMVGPNSSAINRAANSWCTSTDQRGYMRPQAGSCDLGAVERRSFFLNVTVTANWTRDPALMQRLGLHEAVGGES